MYKLISIIAILLLSLGCSPEIIEDSKAGLSITNPIFKNGLLKFTIESKNIEKLYYGVNKEGEGVITDNEVEALAKQEIEVEGLEADVNYIISVKGITGEEITTEQISVSYINDDSEYTGPAYKKIAVVHKFTGSWCGYCPQMTSALKKLDEETPGKFVVAAMHSGDKFESRSTGIIGDIFFISSYPTAVIDYEYKSNYNTNLLKAAFAKSDVSNLATTGIGFSSKEEGANIIVEAKVEFGQTADYKVCCLIMEDGLYEANTAGSVDGYYNHVVRTFATEQMGDPIGVVEAGIEKDFSFSFKKSSYWNIENCQIIVYVLKKNSNGKFTINNANFAKVGEEVLFEILK